VRAAIGVLVVLTLSGCAGERSFGPPTADASMAGRWVLSAPNAPSCGLEFGGEPGARAGKVAADGGCPGNFYMSRRWAIEGGVLTITSSENQPLAQLKVVGPNFEGQSTSGTPLKLAR